VTIENVLTELADLDKQVKTASLTQLSGLLPEDLESLQAQWDAIVPERREEILIRAVELTEENVEMDFQVLFSYCVADPAAKVREKAVHGLWESDDRKNIALLADRLENDSDAAVRAASAMALVRFATLGQEGKLVTKDAERVHEVLMDTLEDTDEDLEVRRRALESVAVSPEGNIREWIDWAYSSNEQGLKCSAVFAMGRTVDESWLPVILEEMDNPDAAMRYEAANASGELGEEDAIPRLAELLDDSDSQVQVAAIHALACIGGISAKKLLRKCAKSDDDSLREMAEEALEMMDMEEAPLSFRHSLT
jgi:HEAT repeat protein